MDAKLVEIIRRRERLLVRAEAQRVELAGIVQQWRGPIAVIDRAMAVVRVFKAHPVLLVIPTAVLAIWRPRRLAALAGRAWILWRFWHSSPLVKWLKHAK
jgi:hypothetical protein